jgi:(5R)-carbapenem-3-carboxylate synthase
LHTDGAFVGTHPSFIILYCAHIDQQPGDGETQLCDQRLAMASMPADLKELFSAPWEYMVHDASHFPSIASQWVSVPPVIEKDDGTRTLNMAMPFELGDPNPGWSVRISGKSTEESTALLRALDQYLKNSESFYSHRWRIGDLLILDNSRVLHGRSAITGARHLYRGQLQ